MDMLNGVPIIYACTREQALRDEVLVDITKEAKEHGFKIPTAITATLLYRYVYPDAETESLGQSMQGRLHDVLTVAYFMARQRPDSQRIQFTVRFVTGEHGETEDVEIVAHIGAGDTPEPVLTIMLPEDD